MDRSLLRGLLFAAALLLLLAASLNTLRGARENVSFDAGTEVTFEDE